MADCNVLLAFHQCKQGKVVLLPCFNDALVVLINDLGQICVSLATGAVVPV